MSLQLNHLGSLVIVINYTACTNSIHVPSIKDPHTLKLVPLGHVPL